MEMELSDFPILPILVENREINKKYLYNNNIRIWTGTKLYCIHNKQVFRCEECKTKKNDNIIEKTNKISENLEKIPEKIENRIIGNKYLYEGELRIWSGKRFNCIHNRNKGRCSECNGTKKIIISEENNEMIEKAPEKNIDRIKGKKYIFDKEIHIWSGTRWKCKHNIMKFSCKECNKNKEIEKEIKEIEKEIEEVHVNFEPIYRNIKIVPDLVIDLVIGQAYLYNNEVLMWSGTTWNCWHLKEKIKCDVCKNNKEIVEIVPTQIEDRMKNKKYLYKEEIRIWNGKMWHCYHGIKPSTCKECDGGSRCEHEKIRTRCKDCGGTEICEHNKRKENCIECQGTQICEHGSRKHRCTECKTGGSICSHGKRQDSCIECNGSRICEHGKQKQQCRLCEGSQICINCKHTSFSTYKPYCSHCYYHLHPDVTKPTKYKDKEWYIHDFLRDNLNDIQFRHDLPIDNGCSRRRPDWFHDCLTHSLIIEADENKHQGYTCENKRIMELFEDLGNRPLVVIRFNPDKYRDLDNKIVESCFYYDNPVSITLRIREEEWNQRSKKLLETIKYHIENIPDKEFTEIKLFF